MGVPPYVNALKNDIMSFAKKNKQLKPSVAPWQGVEVGKAESSQCCFELRDVSQTCPPLN